MKGKRIRFWWGDRVASHTRVIDGATGVSPVHLQRRGRAATPSSPLVGYFCVRSGCGGADGSGAGADVGPVRGAAKIESVIEVSMKVTTDQVVARERTEAAPRGPNAVWLPCPPKAAARSPLFPLCSNTTAIRNRQTITWITTIKMVITKRLRPGRDPIQIPILRK